MASARQAVRADTPVGLATAPAAPLDLSAKGGKSPAGPADKDPLLAENVPAAPLAAPSPCSRVRATTAATRSAAHACSRKRALP